MSRLLLLASVLALGACSSGSALSSAAPAPAPVASAPAPAKTAMNPVGSYEFNTEINGSPMKGQVMITGAPGAWTGKMTSDITPELPLTSVVVDGQTMKLVLDTPNGAATINMTFTGAAFTGTWELGGAGGALTGKRIK
ncbi:MAG: hypothetical protein HY275_04280 [Gemmatimonadetes bacterium]|nr:hypothetical protein [Gemmatimonadota bacterium]